MVFRLAIHNLDMIHNDFMNTIPDPRMRVVNDGIYWGPIHIICAPGIVSNYSNTT